LAEHSPATGYVKNEIITAFACHLRAGERCRSALKTLHHLSEYPSFLPPRGRRIVGQRAEPMHGHLNNDGGEMLTATPLLGSRYLLLRRLALNRRIA
jgi:hypothetical protein